MYPKNKILFHFEKDLFKEQLKLKFCVLLFLTLSKQTTDIRNTVYSICMKRFNLRENLLFMLQKYHF